MFFSATAQDIIIFTNGAEEKAKVTEVGDDVVKYKTWGNLDGPTWVRKTSDIFMIRYENGTKQNFTTIQQTTQQYPSQQPIYSNNQQINSDQSPICFEVPAATDYGAYVRGGFNTMFFQVSDGVSSEGATFNRGSLSIGGYVDIAKARTITSAIPLKDTSIAAFTTTEFSLGACYTSRGGVNKVNDAKFSLQYIVLRPAMALRGRHYDGKNAGVFHYGLELGILTSATMTSLSRGVQDGDMYEECSPLSYGFFMDCFFHVSQYITLGGYLEFSLPLVKYSSQGLDMNSENLAIGISLGFESAGKRLKIRE